MPAGRAHASPPPGTCPPQRAQALRRGQPGAAVVPDAGVDARGRHPDRGRASRRLLRRPRRAWCSTPAGGSTWPRSRASPRGAIGAATRGSTSGARPCAPASTRRASSPPTWPAGWRSVRRPRRSCVMIDAVGNPQSCCCSAAPPRSGSRSSRRSPSDRPLRVVLAGPARPRRLDAARARLEEAGCAVETIDFDALDDRHATPTWSRKAVRGRRHRRRAGRLRVLGDNEQAWTDVGDRRRAGAGQLHRRRCSVGVALGERLRRAGPRRRSWRCPRRRASGPGARTSSTAPRKAGLDAFYTGLGRGAAPAWACASWWCGRGSCTPR